MKLLKEELRGAKAEVESCRQKYDGMFNVNSPRGAVFHSLGPLFSTQLIYNVLVDTVLYRNTMTSVVFINGMWR